MYILQITPEHSTHHQNNPASTDEAVITTCRRRCQSHHEWSLGLTSMDLSLPAFDVRHPLPSYLPIPIVKHTSRDTLSSCKLMLSTITNSQDNKIIKLSIMYHHETVLHGFPFHIKKQLCLQLKLYYIHTKNSPFILYTNS